MGSYLSRFVKLNGKPQTEQEIYQTLSSSLSENNKLLFAGSLLKRAFKLFPESPALITTSKTVTYKELYYQAITVSKTLASHGVGPRDKVVLYYENSLEFYAAYFAVWHLGAVVVPTNTFFHEKELLHVINDSQAKLVIASPTFATTIAGVLAHPDLNNPPQVLGQEIFDWNLSVPHANDSAYATQNYELDNDELCALLYTSGTTGTPKGVALSSKNIMTNAMQGYARFTTCGMGSNEKFFCVLPLFHVFAQNTCLWLPIMIGASIIIVSKIDRKFILEGLKLEPTLFFGFPALYGLLCLMRTAPLDSIKLFISGADMLPDKIRLGFSIIYGRKICSGYGLSEASPVISVNQSNRHMATNVVGKPLVGITCDIRDDQGASLGTNTIGNLWVKGDNIMLGYYNAPQATQAILVDGWLNTGDRATLDEDGVLAICGRSKDIIIHKGFNIYPAEIENILMQHPTITKAAVIGHDDPLTGQIPVAFVAAKKIDSKLENELRTLCTNNLAAYKVPRKFVCLEDLPLNATGKVDKKRLSSVNTQS